MSPTSPDTTGATAFNGAIPHISTSTALSRLPMPFSLSAAESFELISQGAEATVFKTKFLSDETCAALKVRQPKGWRHTTLDRRLTRQRILAEARVLVKCRREGLAVPDVLALDWEKGWLICSWIDGITIKEAIRQWSSARVVSAGSTAEPQIQASAFTSLLQRIGICVGILHSTGVVHGDLTTSNMMLQRPSFEHDNSKRREVSELDGEVVLIDFGLAQQTVQDEDRAVDLYVLERAFGSTHPREEEFFAFVLQAYATSFKGSKSVLKRLEDVRLRGRKKSMIG